MLEPESPDAAHLPWWRAPWSFVRHQWQCIDDELLDPNALGGRAAQDRALAISIVTFALCLTLQRYFGTSSTGDSLIRFFFPTFAEDPVQLDWGARMYWAAFKAISYVGIPLLLVTKVWRDSPKDHGLRWHHSKSTYWIYTVMILGAMLIAAGASNVPAFVKKYPMFAHAASGPAYFWSWELAYGFQFACLEFFFRGVMLFILAKRFGHLALFIGILPYSMIHFTKPVLETVASIVGGVALGTLSLRTRSIYGGIVAHCMIAWCMDFCALWHKGELLKAMGL